MIVSSHIWFKILILQSSDILRRPKKIETISFCFDVSGHSMTTWTGKNWVGGPKIPNFLSPYSEITLTHCGNSLT